MCVKRRRKRRNKKIKQDFGTKVLNYVRNLFQIGKYTQR
jgi:hypothetical protein